MPAQIWQAVPDKSKFGEIFLPNSVPSLEELLAHPTVVLLGAGASVDYGFPLWDDLKQRMLSLCKDNSFLRNGDHEAAEWWIEKLTRETHRTVDGLAAEAGDAANELFRKMVGNIIVSSEAEHIQSNASGWVEAFCKKLLDLPRSDGETELVENLGFISLNYDRSFAYLYQKYFVDRYLESFERQREARLFWRNSAQNFRLVFHPHSAVGLLPREPTNQQITMSAQTIHNPSEHMSVPYGDIEAFNQRFFNQTPHIFAVDELGITRYAKQLGPTYQSANSLLQKATNLLVIGVSKAGWEQSHLQVPPNCNVITTGDCSFNGVAKPSNEMAVGLVKLL